MDAPTDDAWQQSCAPGPLVTRVESGDPHYGTECIHGGWYLEAFNGTTSPATGGRTVPVAPVPITIGSNPLDPTSTFAVHVSGSGQVNTAGSSRMRS